MNSEERFVLSTSERLSEDVNEETAKALIAAAQLPRSMWEDTQIWIGFASWLLLDETYGIIRYALEHETSAAIVNTVSLLRKHGANEPDWQKLRGELKVMHSKISNPLDPYELKQLQMDEAREWRQIYNVLTDLRDHFKHKMEPMQQAHRETITATQWALACIDSPYKAGSFVHSCAGVEMCAGGEKMFRRACFMYAEKLSELL